MIAELIGGLNGEINCIYGPATSGKTTLAILASIEAAKKGGRVLFIDTEGGFSIDRFKQMAGDNYIDLLQRIIIFRVRSFEEQTQKIKDIYRIINKFNLVVVDSLSVFYRKAIHENLKDTNEKMIEQLRILSHIVKEYQIPVLLTNQVYAKPGTDEDMMVGGEMVKKFAKKLISLHVEPRKLKIIKPEEKEINFKIVAEGIVL